MTAQNVQARLVARAVLGFWTVDRRSNRDRDREDSLMTDAQEAGGRA